jgi:lipoprotein signal peptidase
MRFRTRGIASNASSARKMPRSSSPNAVVFWPVVACIVVADVVTKMIALNTLTLFTPQQVAGDALRLTLVRNKGAAFGLYLGDYSGTSSWS